ncbi:hypothetical protein KL86PLE_30351 [uncultured Pleomorphomonas sp.]|uniref:Uncharacterized protein n=1 Tax=uncultured Pleomorphomonas sp. TaxID=442121 RepID=A0A212LEB2_9HYPH|nr:hypothetical protein KL86PLE_30351 [uncultured Pleomorphomonas sp.]
MPTALMATRTSSAAGSSVPGTSISRRRISSMPSRTTAFIFIAFPPEPLTYILGRACAALDEGEYEGKKLLPLSQINKSVCIILHFET